MSKRLATRHRRAPARQYAGTVEPIVESRAEQTLASHDDGLLERARTQWQFGDWQSLAQINLDTLEYYPERAKLALLAAAGRLQTGGNDSEARQFIRLAQSWGASKKLINQILIAGVHNSLGRAAAISNQRQRASQHFENAITVGMPGSDTKLLTRARIDGELNQFGILDDSLISPSNIVSKNQNHSHIAFYSNSTPIEGSAADIGISEFSSAKYWRDRYQIGGNSGKGSYGELAKFKASIINCFIESYNIHSMLDLGCGDGNQLSLFEVAEYTGVDISEFVIEKLCVRYSCNSGKKFLTEKEFLKIDEKYDLTISMDVLFHLIEDDVFHGYLHELFKSSSRYVVIYAPDKDVLDANLVSHVKGRSFTKWVKQYKNNWELFAYRKNDYPFDRIGSLGRSSFSDFYFYRKLR